MLCSTTERATLCAMLVDDGYLIERLRTGDEVAFEELVEHHAAPLLAVTRRILRDEEEARDAVQETVVAAFRGIVGVPSVRGLFPSPRRRFRETAPVESRVPGP